MSNRVKLQGPHVATTSQLMNFRRAGSQTTVLSHCHEKKLSTQYKWGAFPPLVCEKCFLRTKYSSPRSKMHVTDVVVVHHSVGNPFLWLVLSCCSLIPQLFCFFPTFFYFNQAGWFLLHFSANAHHLSIAIALLNSPAAIVTRLLRLMRLQASVTIY